MEIQRSWKWNRLLERINRFPTAEGIALARNLAYGGAAACLVMLTQILQLNATDTALDVSVFGAAIALPLWIATGTIYEFFMTLGERSHAFMRRKALQTLVTAIMLPAILALFASVGGMIWHLSHVAFGIFVLMTCVAIIYVLAFQHVLGIWWYREGGPGANEAKRDGDS